MTPLHHLALACVVGLLLAGCYADEGLVRTRVVGGTGGLDARIDPRVYVDRPFEVTLPADRYRRITILTRDGSPTPTPGAGTPVRVVGELASDPVLLGLDPVHVAAPLLRRDSSEWPEAHGEDGPQRNVGGEMPERGLYQVRVEREDGSVGTLDFALERLDDSREAPR